jgi:AcrR family transcriptional regulator
MLLREEILDVARELFVKHGYENVSMRKIASKIEYSPTTIYLYFKDKSEILHTLCEETFGRLSKVMGEIEHAPGDPVAKLRQLGLAYIHFGLEHPNHYQVTFMTRLEELVKTPEEFARSAGMRTFQSLVNCIQACVESGQFRNLDVMAASQSFWSSVHGVTSLLITQCGFPFVERDVLLSTVVDATIDGFRSIAKATLPPPRAADESGASRVSPGG